MNLESLITSYGYVAIVVGAFLEGETILVLGGFAAHRGYLELPWVIFAAFVGSLIGDQLYFFLGRTHRTAFLNKRPTWKARVEKFQKLLERFRTPIILIFRFLYGLRLVAPFAIGMSTVPIGEFIFLNTVGALVWAILIGAGGYFFGNALEAIIGDIKHYEFKIMAAICMGGIVIWIIHLYRLKKYKIPPLKTPE